MSLINYATKEINCKIVYYGPGLGGKTTNIKYIYSKVSPESRGKLMSLDTELDRTLFFDFLPVNLGKVKGFSVHFHFYTVPGQVYYNASRKLILKGVDGLIFVADSQIERFEDCIDSLENLKANLSEYSKKLEELPLVIQYNKRDLPNIVSIAELEEALNPREVFSCEGVATEGIGVFEPLKVVSKEVLRKLK
ncbi:gliding-motility protein MglA [candidate division WOR-3 bacterium]|nr:gliding-motility protein MglA [candidate division WOR-3 bacterium]MCK4526675.1 gliding-motility protein MglA [candidate division WOR-3 bacterium]